MLVCTVRAVELVLEAIVQLVFELAVQGLTELGFRGARVVWRHVLGRALVHGLAGLAFGAWWAQRLEGAGRTTAPNLLWVSLALAVAGAVRALYLQRREGERAAAGPLPYRNGVLPWQWSPDRWVPFTALNAGLAAGVLLFFDAA